MVFLGRGVLETIVVRGFLSDVILAQRFAQWPSKVGQTLPVVVRKGLQWLQTMFFFWGGGFVALHFVQIPPSNQVIAQFQLAQVHEVLAKPAEGARRR